MATRQPLIETPVLDAAAILLVGSEESHLELIANAMLRELKTFEVKIHIAQSLPLVIEKNKPGPRFDMVVFLINLHSQLRPIYCFRTLLSCKGVNTAVPIGLFTVMSSIAHLDIQFFLGKVCFLAVKGKHGQVQHCIVDITVVKHLADKYLSVLIQSELDNEDDIMYTARRLLNMLKICAGQVPGITPLYMGSVMKRF